MPQPPQAPQVPPPLPTPRVTVIGGGDSPLAIYRAQVAKRDELGNQLNDLRNARGNLANELRDPMVTGADRVGLEGRITEGQRFVTRVLSDRETAAPAAPAALGTPLEARVPR